MDQYDKIKRIVTDRLEKIKSWKEKVQKSLKKAPEGSLVISRSNGVPQFFHKKDPGQKRGVYIEKRNRKLIGALAQKDYDKAFFKLLIEQEKKLQRVLRNLPGDELEELHSGLTEARKEFVKPYVLSDEEYKKHWLNMEYTGKIYPNEFPGITTDRGEKVRSKSEKIIADKLFAMGLPYRYEYPLELKGYGTVYPDFTILRMSTKEEVYIEHFGMMDNPEYCEKAILKMNNLAKNGIILGKNLFITMETQRVPLNTNLLEGILNELR